MQFFLLFLFLATFIFLFTLYWMGRDDLVLLRKNIALEQLFNLTFICLGIGFFFSRLFYVLFNPSVQYLNPLVFLVFPYFPGLSLFGGIFAVLIFLSYLKVVRKIPFLRITDFFALSLLSSFPLGYIGQIFISPSNERVILFILALLYVFTTALFFLYLYPKLLGNQIKEGRISIFFLLIFSVISLVTSFFLHKNGILFFLGGEEIGRILLFAGSVIALVYPHFTLPKKQSTTGQ